MLGHILRIEAVFLLMPLAVALYTGGGDAKAFLITLLLTAAVGQALSCIRPGSERFQARDGFAAVALSWIGMSAFGALPYVLSGAIPDYPGAFFETVSGFTTTGATVLGDIESLPMGTLFWRALTQWMGGMGVLVLTLALLPKTGEGSVYLMRAESPGPIKTKLLPKIRDTATVLYKIYIALTVGETVCLRLAGMSWYDALTHSFTTISTGGFSVKAASIAAYPSLTIHWIIIIFMFLSGVNFSLLFFALRRNFTAVFHSEELRWYTLITLGATGLVFANLVVVGRQAFSFPVFTDALFQVVTVVTTTGYATQDFALWPILAQMVLFVLMISGSCAGSTAGGVKTVRMVLLMKNLRREVHRIIHPRVVQPIRLDGERVEESTLSGVSLFFYAYILLTMVGAVVVAWDNVGFVESISASLTCIGNVGPALGALGPNGNLGGLSALSKLVLSANMLLGRLEIMPLLVLLFPSMWRK